MNIESEENIVKKDYNNNASWENWALYTAIPWALAATSSLAGAYFAGSYFGSISLKAQVQTLENKNQEFKTEIQVLKAKENFLQNELKEITYLGLRMVNLERVVEGNNQKIVEGLGKMVEGNNQKIIEGLEQVVEENNQKISDGLEQLESAIREKLIDKGPFVLDDREHFMPVHSRHSVGNSNDNSFCADHYTEVMGGSAQSDGGISSESEIEEISSTYRSVPQEDPRQSFFSSYNNPIHANKKVTSSSVAAPTNEELQSTRVRFEEEASLESQESSGLVYGVEASMMPSEASSSVAGRTPGKTPNPFFPKSSLLRTPVAKPGGNLENLPKTPGGKAVLTATKKAVDTINGTREPVPSIEELNKDIDRFMSKFSDYHGYREDNREVLKNGLGDLLKDHFKEGSAPGQVYALLDNIFKDDGTLSVKSDDKRKPAEFTEIFDALKKAGWIQSTKAKSFKNVDRNDPFGLGKEATDEILTYEDVNSAYMFYLFKVITATVVASSMAGADAQEINYNQDVYADDFSNDDEASDAEIEVELEQASEETKVEEVTFNEKFIALLPWYGEIATTSAASSAVKVSATIAWKYLTYDAASAVVEMILPKDSVMSALVTTAVDTAVFEAIYGQAAIAFNYVCAAPEVLEAVGQEGIAYSA